MLHLLLTASLALPNKYAQHSKAEQVQKNLKFSNTKTTAAARPPHGGAVEQQDARAERSAASSATRERARWAYPDASRVDQKDPSTFGFSEVGYVQGAHAVRGELRIKTDSDFAEERLCTPGPLWLRRPNRRAPREVRLLDGRRGPGGRDVYLVRLAGVSTREDADALRGSTLFVRREIAPQLEEGELLLWQLEGLRVALAEPSADGTGGSSCSYDEGETVGRVVGVIPREELTGDPELGNDLLEVELARPADGCGGAVEADEAPPLVLIPHVDAIVPEVRLEAGLILLTPPSGLLQLLQPRVERRVRIRGLLPERAQSLLRPGDQDPAAQPNG